MSDGYDALTEREKATLRLIVRGHDAKSAARTLGLSVHTINERLRDARRKLGVSSSREAARIVLAREGDVPEKLGDTRLGEAPAPHTMPPPMRKRPPSAAAIGGAIIMSLALTLVALLALPQAGSGPSPLRSPRPRTPPHRIPRCGGWRSSIRPAGRKAGPPRPHRSAPPTR